METPVGARVSVSGGYDFEPPWLGSNDHFAGRVVQWIAGQNDRPACVVELDEAITATGRVRGRREERTGRFLVLELRYVGQSGRTKGPSMWSCANQSLSTPRGPNGSPARGSSLTRPTGCSPERGKRVRLPAR